MPTQPTPPRLVEIDPWLAPYTHEISERRQRAEALFEDLRSEHGSLKEAARLHQEWGFQFYPATGEWIYREWAPAARALSLVGDFNDWDRQAHPMQRGDDGVWSISLPESALQHEQLVKVHVIGADGNGRDRIPACIRRAVQNPETYDFAGQIWHPAEPYEFKNSFRIPEGTAPLIYEAHPGMAGEEQRVHSYREFQEDVLPRIAKGGYNTIQLMAIQEHPYYGSFGYHVSSFFAPSSRFGTPEELKELIDTAHGLGIAVLLDIVHSHAVKNIAEGLSDFDGSGGQYFHHGDKGEHPQWDSKIFDYGKHEVRDFLLSNLRYWLEEFQFDGFRFDGVTSMLYHHHGLEPFDHYDKYFRHGVDTDAVLYLQAASELSHEIRPDALLVAEDMSGMPGLCRPIAEGGMGFSYRLAMGVPDFWIKLLKHQPDEQWDMHEIWDTLNNRRAMEPAIAYAESHDQALVGDKTLAFWLMDQEMYWNMKKSSESVVVDRGIALHKIIRLITMSMAGEGYLTFIGNEFGHPEWVDFPREGNDWSFQHCRRQWSLADNPELRYEQIGAFDQAMIAMASEHKLLKMDPAQALNFDQDNQVLIAERGNLIFTFNFSPSHSIPDYRFPVLQPGEYRVILDSDKAEFGGHERQDASVTHFSQPDGNGGHEISVYLPSRTAMVFAKIG